VHLPTTDFDVVLKGQESIETPLGEYPAYVFGSGNSKFRLWISADERRVPLRIENPKMFSYSLLINDIQNTLDTEE
jgi:hypothetical protein